MQYDALIAGGGHAPWLKEYAGTDLRLLAKIKGKRFVDYIVEALKSSGYIDKICICVPPEAVDELARTTPDFCEVREAGNGLPHTCLVGSENIGQTNPQVLVVCDDIPMLTGEAVADFLKQCGAFPHGELIYPINKQEVCLAKYPDATRTYGKSSHGSFTGGNMMLVDKRVMPRGQVKANEIFARRKNPFSLASWLGWSFIFKLVLHKLSVQDVEKRVTELMEMESHAIFSDYPEIGMDVDKPSDFELAEKYL